MEEKRNGSVPLHHSEAGHFGDASNNFKQGRQALQPPGQALLLTNYCVFEIGDVHVGSIGREARLSPWLQLISLFTV